MNANHSRDLTAEREAAEAATRAAHLPRLTYAMAADIGLAVPGVDFPASLDPDATYSERPGDWSVEQAEAEQERPAKRRAWQVTCPECGRTFDLTDSNDAADWSFGHDCEAES